MGSEGFTLKGINFSSQSHCTILVGSEGFEPPKAKPGDLQSPPFDRSGNCPKEKTTEYKNQNVLRFEGSEVLFCYILEPLVGFEPTTIRLQGECSTSWAKVAFSQSRNILFLKQAKSNFFAVFLTKYRIQTYINIFQNHELQKKARKFSE